MGAEQFTNFASTTLDGVVAADATTIEVHDGSRFPTADFYILIDGTNAAREICWVQSRNNNTLELETTSNRGLKDTVATLHRNGAQVVHTVLAHHIEEAIKGAQIFLPGRPQGTLVNEHHFDTTTEGFTATAGSVAVSNGELRFTAAAGDSFAVSAGDSIADGEFVWDVYTTGNPGQFGGAWRYVDTNNWYLWYWNSVAGDFRIVKLVSGVLTTLVDYTDDQPVNLNANHRPMRVLVRAVGAKHDIYINDKFIASLNDASISSGKIAGYGGTSTIVAYPYIATYSLPSSWNPSWTGGKFETKASGDLIKWEADAVPPYPNSMDDEFDGATLDSDWTQTLQNTTQEVRDGSFLITMPVAPSSADRWAGIYKTAPSGDFSVTAKIDVSIPHVASTYCRGGVMVRDSAGGDFITLGPERNGGTNLYEIRSLYWTGTTLASVAMHSIPFQGQQYYRIRKIGTTLYFDVSSDGKAWSNLGTEAIATRIGSVGQIGFGYSNHSVSQICVARTDFIRVGTDTSLFAKTGAEVYLDRTGTINAQAALQVYTKIKNDGTTVAVGSTWGAVDAAGGLDISLPASIGDTISANIGCVWAAGAAADMFLDVAIMANGSPVHFFGDAVHGGGTTGGPTVWYAGDTELVTSSGVDYYTVQAEDVVNGYVTLRPYARRSASARSLYVSSNQPFTFSASNNSRIVVSGLDPTEGPVQMWMPDAQPESPHDYDDEFFGGLGGGWTTFDPGSTGLQVSTEHYGLRLRQPPHALSKFAGIVKEVPLGDYSVATKVSLTSIGPHNYSVAALGLLNGVTSTSDLVVFNITYSAGAGLEFNVQSWSDYATYVSAISGISVYADGIANSHAYLRLRVSGTTVFADLSFDGKGWIYLGQGTLPFTPTHAGLLVDARNSPATHVTAIYNFIRFTTSLLLEDPIYGRIAAMGGIQQEAVRVSNAGTDLYLYSNFK